MTTVGSQRSVVRKGAFCLALCAMLFALCVSVSAQQPRKVFRVGILENVVSARTEAFRQGMRDLGHVEGQNFVIVARFGSDERLRDLADELVKLNVDVIFAPNTNAIQAAKKATRTIPIVMAVPSDAIGSGFVASLARPQPRSCARRRFSALALGRGQGVGGNRASVTTDA
jgi:ABC-type uncharacterized transport system substrate-binding protein